MPDTRFAINLLTIFHNNGIFTYAALLSLNIFEFTPPAQFVSSALLRRREPATIAREQTCRSQSLIRAEQGI
jgi:hypothetical protein